MNRRLHRARDERMIAGVAGGLARYLEIDPSIVRVLWAVLVVLTGGLMLLLYIIMAIVVPEEPWGEQPGAWGPTGWGPPPGWGGPPGWGPPPGTPPPTGGTEAPGAPGAVPPGTMPPPAESVPPAAAAGAASGWGSAWRAWPPASRSVRQGRGAVLGHRRDQRVHGRAVRLRIIGRHVQEHRGDRRRRAPHGGVVHPALTSGPGRRWAAHGRGSRPGSRPMRVSEPREDLGALGLVFLVANQPAPADLLQLREDVADRPRRRPVR